MVTVVILAFNHESFIREAIKNVLLQNVNFYVEIFVLYTDSNDDTVGIIDELVARHANVKKVKVGNTKAFLYQTYAFTKTISSKYIIFTDGDDYWTDLYKLQKQVDFLQQNKEYNGVFHDVSIINQENNEMKNEQLNYYSQFKSYSQFNTYKSDYYPWDAVNRVIIPPGSLLFRTSVLLENLDKLTLVNYSGGWMISLFLLKNSKFKYINEQWSVYRNHHKGITKRKSHDLFVLSNILVLKKLLTDTYYSAIKWDLYSSISKEYQYLINSTSVKSRRKKTHYLILSYYYQLKFTISQFKRIWKNEI